MSIHSVPAATSSARMEPLARLPIFLALDAKRVLLAGGNAAAAWKAELLSAAGACVDVYVERISEELRAIAADPPRGMITVHARPWKADDFTNAVLAVGAFEADADAAVFAQAARAARVPVNIIDKPAFCDFAFGAIVNRSPLVIGISTDGAAPVFAQAIRGKLETSLPKGFAAWAAAAQRWRAAVKASGLSFAARRNFWQRFTRHALVHAASEPAQADFDRLLAEAEAGGPAGQGAVTVVDAGNGDADSLTLYAVRALHAADVILFDDLVSREVLDFARREARKLLVGAAGFGPQYSEDKITALMVGLARQGKRVVRLKGNAVVADADGLFSADDAPGSSATHSGAVA